MNWLVFLLALAAAGTVYGAGRGFGMGAKGLSRADSVFRNGREGLRLLLERVEREEAPDLIRGAMCYRPAAVPERVEYLCPVCDGRTWHGGRIAGMLHGRIDGMRRAMAELRENRYFNGFLDEREFCAHCSVEETEDPGFYLVMAYHEGDTVRARVQLLDLQMLVGLVRGELSFTDSYDARLPLKDRILRLRALLDMEREP